ncbi:hypothetical protein ACN28S_31830 [Cystobacter fuscus]
MYRRTTTSPRTSMSPARMAESPGVPASDDSTPARKRTAEPMTGAPLSSRREPRRRTTTPSCCRGVKEASSVSEPKERPLPLTRTSPWASPMAMRMVSTAGARRGTSRSSISATGRHMAASVGG